MEMYELFFTFIVVEGSPEKRALIFKRNSFTKGSINSSIHSASSFPTTYSLDSPISMALLFTQRKKDNIKIKLYMVDKGY